MLLIINNIFLDLYVKRKHFLLNFVRLFVVDVYGVNSLFLRITFVEATIVLSHTQDALSFDIFVVLSISADTDSKYDRTHTVSKR